MRLDRRDKDLGGSAPQTPATFEKVDETFTFTSQKLFS